MKTLKKEQLVINWHITGECNFDCHYCYRPMSEINGIRMPEIWRDPKKWKKTLAELANMPDIVPGNWYDRPRLNIAGGEPMLLGKSLSDILSEAQPWFNLSIISNGFLMDDDFVRRWAPQFHTIGISMDSADSGTNIAIARCGKKKTDQQTSPDRIKEIFARARRCNPDIKLKINTVVNSKNWQEKLDDVIRDIGPDRWKIFKVLPVAATEEFAKKQKGMKISDEQFRHFQDNNKNSGCGNIVPEDNDAMKGSYVMVDPLGRFYQSTVDGAGCLHYTYSDPIYEVGAEKAFRQLNGEAPFSEEKFKSRYKSIPLIKEK